MDIFPVRLCLLTVVFWHCVYFSEAGEKMNLLIFGGNGFIGAETVRQLLIEGHSLTLVSRGNWPWDTKKTVEPFVKHLKCNRYKPDSESCAEFWDFIGSENLHFDAVIDFSAYRTKAVEPFYHTLKDKVDLYIYISTDSVYEVSEWKHLREQLKETDSVRPENPEERANLNRRDSYGHHKLEIEEFLVSQRKSSPENSIPYVFLRLPDVLGARDSTDRFWKYQMWLKYGVSSLRDPIPIPNFARELKTSYVYVKDVARAIAKILQQPKIHRDKVYNLAFFEGKTLRELLTVIGTVGLGIDAQVLTESIKQASDQKSDSSSVTYFPSVTRGTLDVEHARSELNWEPTSWENAIKQICNFYSNAIWEFSMERDEAVESLLQDLGVKRTDERKQQFLNAVLADAAKRRKVEL